MAVDVHRLGCLDLCYVIGDGCIPRKRGGCRCVMQLHADIQARCRAIELDCLTPISWHKSANGLIEATGDGAGFYGNLYQPGVIVRNEIEYILLLR